jgi:hypothetical protein
LPRSFPAAPEPGRGGSPWSAQEFIRAREYRDRRAGGSDPGARDLALEVLAAALDGEVKVMLTAQRATEILAALRLQREFGFELILDGAAEAYLLVDEIREAGSR